MSDIEAQIESDEPIEPIAMPGYYFVAFVDLLGQADALAQLGRIPKSREEVNAVFAGMTETGTIVRNVRNSFSRYFTMRGVSQERLERVPPELRDEYRSISSLKAFQVGFSDSFVLSVPLQAVVEDPDPRGFARSVNDLWNALFGLSCLSLAVLRQGIPVRAGADVGLGVEMFPNEVFGPALLNAHRLESQVAEYPRTAIGENLLAYLSMLEQLPQTVLLNEFTANRARDCRRFICAAPDDAWPMLHFLTPFVLASPGDFVEGKRLAHEWVRGQIQKYAAARNGKLFRRYARLGRYFDAYTPPPPSSAGPSPEL